MKVVWLVLKKNRFHKDWSQARVVDVVFMDRSKALRFAKEWRAESSHQFKVVRFTGCPDGRRVKSSTDQPTRTPKSKRFLLLRAFAEEPL